MRMWVLTLVPRCCFGNLTFGMADVFTQHETPLEHSLYNSDENIQYFQLSKLLSLIIAPNILDH